MIVKGNFEKDNIKYSSYIIPSDWRFSAALVGMVRYFDFNELPYSIEGRKLYYNYDYVSNSDENLDRYYNFIENTYFRYFQHCKIFDEIFDKDVLIRELSNVFYLKKLVKNLEWKEGINEIQSQISEIVRTNKKESIDKVYINPFSDNKLGYSSYLQPSCFRKTKLKTCRVLGYYTDPSRKLKSVGWGFEKDSYVFEDHIEFDFIPFGFTYGYSSCLINCNSDVETLIDVNNIINSFLREHSYLNFEGIFISEIKDEIPCPVEIITRVAGKKSAYTSIFYREESKQVFDYITENELSNFDFVIKTKYNDINLLSDCMNSILKMTTLDDLIIQLLKTQDNRSTNLNLIKINSVIYDYYKKGGCNGSKRL